ncbi:NUDIX hydrolase [Commensalibacter melissae]|uniref:NUDIX hydrolase n=1 Tax=Commensalibacter melissae TaxID=2070537 RepID=UPI0012D988EE|nr:hypothetical protein [Commensalibacter melissae]MUG77174.1 hypothetical protein [Commensalibacter melissae]
MSAALTQTELIAVLVSIIDYMPYVMTIHKGSTLPSGSFEPGHQSLQAGLRAWIHQQTRYPVGFLEQLYTFADQDRIYNQPQVRTISISYLGLVRHQNFSLNETEWHGWYEYFPWENELKPAVKNIRETMVGALYEWQSRKTEDTEQTKRRIEFLFGLNGYAWNEDLILQRYELLYEAGMISEAGNRYLERKDFAGQGMFADHRRILATAIARLRAQIKYKALVFELMPTEFTLLQLQKTIERIIGRSLHKSNFRRMIEQQNLIEETGHITDQYRGRPAKLFRYQKSIVDARAMSGSKLPLVRN